MTNLFALISAILMGFGYAILKKSNKKEGAKYLSQAIFSLIIFMGYLIVADYNFHISLKLIVVAVLSSILAEALPIYALQRGNLAINAAVFSTYPAFTIITSFFINSEEISLIQGCLVAITLASLASLSFNEEKTEGVSMKIDVSVVIAIVTAFAVGLSDSISKFFINESSTKDFILALATVQIPVAFLMIQIQESGPQLSSSSLKFDKFTTLGGLLLSLSLIFFWESLARGITGISSSIASVSAVFTIPFAVIFLKEFPTRKQIPLIAIALVSVLCLSFV